MRHQLILRFTNLLRLLDVAIAVEGATDAACGAADSVLTEPGLSIIVHAIRGSHFIFQRMRNCPIYARTITIHIVVIVSFEFDFPLHDPDIPMLNDATITDLAIFRVFPYDTGFLLLPIAVAPLHFTRRHNDPQLHMIPTFMLPPVDELNIVSFIPLDRFKFAMKGMIVKSLCARHEHATAKKVQKTGIPLTRTQTRALFIHPDMWVKI
ncbi:hypothetical protein H0H93_002622 [Arthromyces matolae]|nr:hypothetical protein H0H93_002622 [Arthromyces matolae]